MRKSLLKKFVMVFAVLFAFTVSAAAEDARLLSFGFYMEDNTNLTADYVAEIPAFVSGTNTYEINIALPANVDKSQLIARFTVNSGNTVSVDGTAQTSQVSKNDFEDPVDYTVSNSNKTQNIRYTINVVELKSKGWTEVATLDAAALSGVEGFTGVYSDAKMVVSPKDKAPYVAYGARGVDEKMSVAKFEDGVWKQVGSALFSPIINGSHFDFDIANDGTPYVAFGDKEAATSDNSTMYSLSVMKFDGSTWSNVGDKGFYASQAQYVGIAALDNGLAACLQNNNRNVSLVRYGMGVATWDGSAWTTGESSLLPTGQPIYTCKMGDNGKVATLISINRGKIDDVNYGHNIFKYENGTWESLATNFLETGATQTSIAIGSFGTKVATDGTIYAWTGDDAPNTTKVYQVRLKKYNAETKKWEVVGGNTLPIGHDTGFESHISLDVAISPDGTPFVAYNHYSDQQKLYVMYLDPNTNQWTSPQQLATEASDVNIDFDADGIGYISYTDKSNKIHLFKYDYVTSGIKTFVNNAVAGETYYNLSGVRVASPVKGVYIKRTVDSNGKVSTQKILKK
ncbi:MAG: hypothetical protein IKH64_08795 [Prevotella sp.]|nr:hypothetical protein [Prevotella sp.]